MFLIKIILPLIISANIFASPFDWLEDNVQSVYDSFSRFAVASPRNQSEVVLEATSMKVISESHSDEIFPAGHFAKLMTLLITAECIEEGDISIEDIVVTSKYANSMQGTQIWLDIGEKITVRELIKAITIGNANDACVALAEAVAESEKAFVERMNVRASKLGMESTYFADCTGISDATTTSAYDIAVLTAELSKHDWLFEYTTTWMDNVRNGKTELVNNNTLVRSYNGIIGFKALGSENVFFLSAAAKRNDMTIVYVKTFETDKDILFSRAKEAMNSAFSAFELYTPEYDDEILSDCSVNCGEKLTCKVQAKNDAVLLIPKWRSSDVEISYQRVDMIPAPVKKGTVIGDITVKLGDETIFSTQIVTSESVNKLSLLEMYRRLLLELLNI